MLRAPRTAKCHEPQQCDGAEQLAHAARTVPLDKEQTGEHADGDRNDELLECRCGDAETFHGREYGDCRSDQRIAVKQGCGKDACRDDPHLPARRTFRRTVCQCGQCEHAAFAVVVELEHDPHVFDRDDEHHRPEQRGQCRQHVRFGGRQAMRTDEGFLECIQGTGADVAVHHAERGQRQCSGAMLFYAFASISICLPPPAFFFVCARMGRHSTLIIAKNKPELLVGIIYMVLN